MSRNAENIISNGTSLACLANRVSESRKKTKFIDIERILEVSRQILLETLIGEIKQVVLE